MSLGAITRGRPLALFGLVALLVYVLGMTLFRFLFWPGFVLGAVWSLIFWFRVLNFVAAKVRSPRR